MYACDLRLHIIIDNDDTLDNDNANYYFSSALMLKVFQ